LNYGKARGVLEAEWLDKTGSTGVGTAYVLKRSQRTQIRILKGSMKNKMRIKKVETRDYKVFYGLNEFNVEGKDLFIYGENGSGKSSFYYALKGFFNLQRQR